ncbi:hypothetical protein C8R43DRAFT_1026161 [Mycena crocata]|nr:hypothetical protein C8R43DRAFT_1026161 [Mycena crocata]
MARGAETFLCHFLVALAAKTIESCEAGFPLPCCPGHIFQAQHFPFAAHGVIHEIKQSKGLPPEIRVPTQALLVNTSRLVIPAKMIGILPAAAQQTWVGVDLQRAQIAYYRT